MATTIDAPTLAGWLVDGAELALLDAQNKASTSTATSSMLRASRFPHSNSNSNDSFPVATRLVWCDGGDGTLAGRAGARSEAMGWTNVAVLEGGTTAWAAAGYELYSGVNVPSKAFGEFVEHTYGTPESLPGAPCPPDQGEQRRCARLATADRVLQHVDPDRYRLPRGRTRAPGQRGGDGP
ncbi:MAG: hypothetical protein R2706_06575 [Acidimicrobiales bacterium]